MAKRVTKIKRIAAAIAFCVIGLAAGIVVNMPQTPFKNKVYATIVADIKVGDYIENFGGNKWRVVGKDENGLLVRSDRSVTNRSVTVPASGYSNDNVMLDSESTGLRTLHGTNYWKQTLLQGWLNDYISNFSETEQEIINQVEQKQILWWGDATKINPNDSDNYVVNFAQAAGAQGTIAFDGQIENFDSDVFRHTINDKIFLLDMMQVYKTPAGFKTVLNPSGTPVSYWTRTPSATDALGGDKMQVVGTNGLFGAALVNTLNAVVPALYIKPEAVFVSSRDSLTSIGEQNGYRVHSGIAPPSELKLTFQSTGHGSVSVDCGEINEQPIIIPYGQNLVFTAAPDEHYRVKQWRINGVVVPNEILNTFEWVATKHALVEVVFEEKEKVNVPMFENGLTYTGSEQAPNIPASIRYTTSVTAKTAVGDYSATLTLTNPARFEWSDDNTTDNKILPWSILKAARTNTVTLGNWTYGGESNNPSVGTVQEGAAVTYSYYNYADVTFTTPIAKPTNAGQYWVRAYIEESASYLERWTPAVSFEIFKAELTITADNKSRDYGDSNPAFTYTPSGFKSSDNAANSITGSFQITTAANTSTNVGSYNINVAAGTAASANYSFKFVTGILTVTARGIAAPTWSDTNIFIYNAAERTLTLEGFDENHMSVTDDAKTEAGEYTAKVRLTSSNYVWEDASATIIAGFVQIDWSITKAILTVTANNVSRVYGAANPVFSVSYGTFCGSDTAAVITGSFLVTTAANTTTGIGAYDINVAIGNASSANYSFDFVKGTLTINPRGIAAPAWSGTNTFVYNAAERTLVLAGFNVSIMSVTDNAKTNFGNYIAKVSLTSPNYVWDDESAIIIASVVQIDWSITKATLTVTADGKTRVYGDANPEFTVTVVGLRGADTFEFIATSIANETTNTGAHPDIIDITPNLSAHDNYNVNYVPGTLIITRASVEKPVVTSTNLVYNGTEQTVTITVDPRYGVTTGDQKTDAGTYFVTVGLDNIAHINYEWADGTLASIQLEWTIEKATLTITANNKSREYANTNPAFDVAYGAFFGTDNPSNSITGSFAFSCSANTASYVGDYTITVSAGPAQSQNYEFSFTNGTLTITKAMLTVTADNRSRVYGNANPTLTYTISGFKGTDTAAVITGDFALSCAATMTSSIGGYTILIVNDDATAFNYDFSFVNGTLTVTTATLIIEISAAKFFDGAVWENDSPISQYISGLKNGETVTAGTLETTDDIVKAYSAYGTSLGADFTWSVALALSADTLGNYTMFYNLYVGISSSTIDYQVRNEFVYDSTDKTIKITPATVTHATIKYRLAESGDYDLDIEQTAFVNVDEYTVYFEITAAGYDTEYGESILKITPAALTVTADNKTRAYDTANPTFTVTVEGLCGSDAFVFTATTTATQSTNTGTYDIVVSANLLAEVNYDIDYLEGTLTIIRASVVKPVVTSSDFTYDGSAKTVTITASALYGVTANGTKTNAGTYFATVALSNKTNYVWDDGKDTDLSLTWSIAKKQITITADNKSREYRDANPDFTYTVNGLVAADDDENETWKAGSFALSTTVNTSDVFGIYTNRIIISAGTAQSENYSFKLFINGTLTITQKQLDKPDAAAKSLQYNGLLQTLVLTDYDGSIMSVAGNAEKNVGNYTATITITNANYKWKTTGTATIAWQITKAPLTVTVENESRIWGYPNPTFTFIFDGLLGDDEDKGTNFNFAATTIAIPSSKVGDYAIIITQKELVNYQVEYNDGTLIISRAPISRPVVTVENGELVYDGTAKSPEIATSAYYSITDNVQTNAGTHYARVKLDDNHEWDDGSLEKLSLEWCILKAGLKITANNKSRVYGENNPTFDVAYGTFFGTDNASNSITGNFALSCSANLASDVGGYMITVSVGTAISANYDFSFVTGTLTITKAILDVIANNKERKYGAKNPDFDVRYSGFVNGDNASNSIVGSFEFSCDANSASEVGDLCCIRVLNSTAFSSNYEFNFIDGILTITRAADITKPTLNGLFTYTGYSQSVKELIRNLDDNSEIVMVKSQLVAKDAGTYTITIRLIDPKNRAWVGDGEFDDIDDVMLTWTIEKAVLVVTAKDIVRVYNTENPELEYRIMGLQGPDKDVDIASVIFGYFYIYTDAEKSSPATTHPTLGRTYEIFVEQWDAYADNYTFEFINGTLVILRISVTKPSIAGSITYDGYPRSPIIPNALYSVTGNIQTNTGNYEATVTLLDPNNCEWDDGTIGPLTLLWKIIKADRTNEDDITMGGWVYEREEPKLPTVNNVREAAETDITYYYATSENGTYSITQPTAPGIYFVYAQIKASSNYNACTTNVVSFTIAAVFTISYENLFGTTHENPAEYHQWSNITLENPSTKHGYVFEGWYRSEDFSGEKVSTIKDPNPTDVTLWAKWELGTFSVTFFGGGGGNVPDKFDAQAFSKIERPDDPERKGYTFKGWYNGKELWDFDNNTIDNDIILTARWKKKVNVGAIVGGVSAPIAVAIVYLLFRKRKRI